MPRRPARPAGPVGFDLDLTLIDSQPAIIAAWGELARETGARIDLDSVIARMGVKLEDEVARWFPAGDRDEAAASYRRHYVRLAPDLTAPLPGAAEALAAVRRAGERAIIVTAKIGGDVALRRRRERQHGIMQRLARSGIGRDVVGRKLFRSAKVSIKSSVSPSE